MLSSIGLQQFLCSHEEYTNLDYTLRSIRPLSQRSIATEKELKPSSIGLMQFFMYYTSFNHVLKNAIVVVRATMLWGTPRIIPTNMSSLAR